MGMNGSAEAVAGRGATTLAVGDRNGNVVLSFPHEVGFVALDPTTAVQVGKSMIDAAVKCGANVSIQAPRPEIPKSYRERAINRVVMLLRNKRDSAESDNIFSTRIVDTVINMMQL